MSLSGPESAMTLNASFPAGTSSSRAMRSSSIQSLPPSRRQRIQLVRLLLPSHTAPHTPSNGAAAADACARPSAPSQKRPAPNTPTNRGTLRSQPILLPAFVDFDAGNRTDPGTGLHAHCLQALPLRYRLSRNRARIALPALAPMRPIAERPLRRQTATAQARSPACPSDPTHFRSHPPARSALPPETARSDEL